MRKIIFPTEEEKKIQALETINKELKEELEALKTDNADLWYTIMKGNV